MNETNRFLRFIYADGEAAVDQREEDGALRRKLVSYLALSHQYVIVLSLAACIASFGLMANAAVAIVGAMLIAPLMKPIMAFAYATALGDKRLAIRSMLTLVLGVLATLLFAALVETILGLRNPTEEIMSRTHPSLIDLGIAVAAGIAAALAAIRANVADALPGVAVAVALVPPICVAGIALSLGAWSISAGAMLLFVVNLVAIMLSAIVVFLVDGYGSLKRAWLGLLMILLLSAAIAVPLASTLEELRYDDLAQQTVEDYLHEKYTIDQLVHPSNLSQLSTVLEPDPIFIFLEIKSPPHGLDKQQVEALQA